MLGAKAQSSALDHTAVASSAAGLSAIKLGPHDRVWAKIFDRDITEIPPMPVMVAPPHVSEPYHVWHSLSVNGDIYTTTDVANNGWRWDGNSGSPFVLSMPDNLGDPDGVVVFVRGATTSGPTVAPPGGTDPIQADINYLTGRAGLSTSQYQLTWYTP